MAVAFSTLGRLCLFDALKSNGTSGCADVLLQEFFETINHNQSDQHDSGKVIKNSVPTLARI